MTEPLTRLLLVLALIGLLGAVLAVPATRYGDASEYVMAAMSVVSDGDLVYEEKDLTRAVAGRPEGTDIPAGLQLVQTGDGVYHFGGHTIYYPALAAPLYAVFGYRGFYILNALLFWAVLVVVAYHYGPGAGFPVALVALVPSAALCYVFWTTPETAILCFLALSLFSWAKGRSFLSGMALGVASAMKFPLALFVVALLAGGRERRSRRSGGLFVAGFLLLFLPQVAYNVVSLNCVHATFLTSSDSSTFMYFRTRVPYCEGFRPTKDVRVMHRWTDASHLSAERVVASLIDPSMGLVWFYPMALYCLAVSPWRRRHLALMAVFLVCLATFCSVQRLFTHQVGLRALNYLYPVLLFLPDRARVRGAVPRLLMGWAVLWGATFAVFPLSNSIDQVDRKPRARAARPAVLPRAAPACARVCCVQYLRGRLDRRGSGGRNRVCRAGGSRGCGVNDPGGRQAVAARRVGRWRCTGRVGAARRRKRGDPGPCPSRPTAAPGDYQRGGILSLGSGCPVPRCPDTEGACRWGDHL
jgi:hypothetical protein